VVDDDFQLCEFLSDLLESDGFEVLKAWNGEEALRLVETITPDLVLLDIHMPHLDGIQTCAELRKRPKTAHTPILMLTAVIEEESIEQAFVAGATDYMAKPPSPLALRFPGCRTDQCPPPQPSTARNRNPAAIRHSPCVGCHPDT
jgi:Response regulators consisting of a CheY-like receiver domain and a winged-helix DNA-binding domain